MCRLIEKEENDMAPEAYKQIVVRGIYEMLANMEEERLIGRTGYSTPRYFMAGVLLAYDHYGIQGLSHREAQVFYAERLLEALDELDPREGAIARETFGEPKAWDWAVTR
jgi:hypothetical protein